MYLTLKKSQNILFKFVKISTEKEKKGNKKKRKLGRANFKYK